MSLTIEERTEKLMQNLSNIDLRMSIENFSTVVLDTLSSVIPEFSKGRIMIKNEDNTYKCIAWKGYSDSITDLEIREEDDPINVNGTPKVYKNIYDIYKQSLSEHMLDVMTKSRLSEIKVSIAIGISFEDEIIGKIFVESDVNMNISQHNLHLLKIVSKISSLFIGMKIFQERERKYQRDIIKAMIKALEARDRCTVGHSERVALYSVHIAKELDLDIRDIDKIYWGSIIHDVGKLSIPEYILMKPSRLSPFEYERVKNHPIIGESMIKDFLWLEKIRPIVRNHHERWDGKGYPDGLAKEKIPIEVRIVSIADAFDAMTSDRVYRKAYSLEHALSEIIRLSGKQFDPSIAKIAVDVLNQMFPTIKERA